MTAAPAALVPAASARARSAPAAAWLALLAGLVRYAGAVWDVAWHRTIGRDDFWSPPHDLIYLGVALGLLAAAWAVAEVVLAHRGELAWRRAVRTPYILPLVGGALIIVAAPIDDAWHRLVGKDVDIWSPPHLLAVLGSAVGVLGWTRALRGAAGPDGSVAARVLAALFAGLLLYAGWFALNWYHMVAASRDVLVYPALAAFVFLLIGAAPGPGTRPPGGRTAAALVFLAVAGLPVLLFPALGWRAPAAPPLLILPALLLDLVEASPARRDRTVWTVAGAVLFALALLLVELARFSLVPAPDPFGEDLAIVGPYVEWARQHPWTPSGALAAWPVVGAAAVAGALLGGALRRAMDGWFRD